MNKPIIVVQGGWIVKNLLILILSGWAAGGLGEAARGEVLASLGGDTGGPPAIGGDGTLLFRVLRPLAEFYRVLRK